MYTPTRSPNYVGYHVCVLSADITFADPGNLFTKNELIKVL